jgi:hypothetical protein
MRGAGFVRFQLGTSKLVYFSICRIISKNSLYSWPNDMLIYEIGFYISLTILAMSTGRHYNKTFVTLCRANVAVRTL